MTSFVDRFRVPLAWGAAILLALLVAVVVGGPLIQAHRDLDGRIDRGYVRLAKLRVLVAGMEETEKKSQGLEQDLTRFIFEDVADADALILRLRKYIDESAAGAGVEINRVDSIGTGRDSVDGTRRAGVLVRATGGLEGIAELLRNIEEHRPILVVDQLEIQPGRARRGRGQVPAEQNVVVTLHVSGFFLEPSA